MSSLGPASPGVRALVQPLPCIWPCCVILSNFITSLSPFISTSGKSGTSLSPDSFPFSVPPAYAPSAKGQTALRLSCPHPVVQLNFPFPCFQMKHSSSFTLLCSGLRARGNLLTRESLPKASLPPASPLRPLSTEQLEELPSVRRHHSCSSKHPLAPTSLQVRSPGLLAVSYLLHLLTHPPPWTQP